MAALTDREARQLQLLAELVTQRRRALRFSSKDKAADACGLSHMPYRNVEAGRPASAATYAKIELAFEMKPGSLQAVLHGADSITLLDGTELIGGAQITRPSPEQLTDGARQAVNVAARMTVPGLTLGQTDELTEQVVKELQRRGIIPAGS
jgi:hypothetical protein